MKELESKIKWSLLEDSGFDKKMYDEMSDEEINEIVKMKAYKANIKTAKSLISIRKIEGVK